MSITRSKADHANGLLRRGYITWGHSGSIGVALIVGTILGKLLVVIGTPSDSTDYVDKYRAPWWMQIVGAMASFYTMTFLRQAAFSQT